MASLFWTFKWCEVDAGSCIRLEGLTCAETRTRWLESKSSWDLFPSGSCCSLPLLLLFLFFILEGTEKTTKIGHYKLWTHESLRERIAECKVRMRGERYHQSWSDSKNPSVLDIYLYVSWLPHTFYFNVNEMNLPTKDSALANLSTSWYRGQTLPAHHSERAGIKYMA